MKMLNSLAVFITLNNLFSVRKQLFLILLIFNLTLVYCQKDDNEKGVPAQFKIEIKEGEVVNVEKLLNNNSIEVNESMESGKSQKFDIRLAERKYNSKRAVKATLVDLTVSLVNVIDEEGPDISYTFSVSNIGSEDATDFYNDFYLSTDIIFTTEDYLIGWYWETSIPAGTTTDYPELFTTVSFVPDGSYYFGVFTDGLNQIEEIIETNNFGYDDISMVNIIVPDCDLTVSNVNVIDATGPDISFTYAISNIGTEDASGTFYDCAFLSSNTTINQDDYFLNSWTHPTGLPADSTYNSGTINTTVTGVPNGSYYLGVITDIDYDISETNELNNTGYDDSPMVSITGATLPDLTVSVVNVTDNTGPDISYEYQLSNTGGAATSGNIFYNEIYLSLDTEFSISDHFIEWESVSAVIPPGGTYNSGILNTTVTGVPDGSYYLVVITDVFDDMTEDNESNNTGYDDSPLVVISLGPLPDLTVSNVNVLVASSSSVIYNYEISNIGSLPASGNIEDNVYLSDNTDIGFTDFLIASNSHSDIIPGGGIYTSSGLLANFTGIPNGNYFLGIITDVDSSITEENESNNSGCNTVTLVEIGVTDILTQEIDEQDISITSYPNPFRESLNINIKMNKRDLVDMDIIDLNGKVMCNVYHGIPESGNFDIVWDGFDLDSRKVCSGVYIIRVKSETIIYERILRIN